MDLRTAITQGSTLLEQGGISVPRLTAEVLLAHALGKERSYFYAHPEEELSELGWIHYGRYLHQRLKRMPTQYITKKQEFWGRDFQVSTDVLIPRPETEHLIETVLAECPDVKCLADIGVGSGAIAVTLSLEMGVKVIATDVSSSALSIARFNAHKHEAQVQFVNCDLCSALADASLDLIVSNPPYVPETDRSELEPEVRDWEPALALFAGPDGLDIYPQLIQQAHRVLKPGGRFIAEMGIHQSATLQAMFGSGWTVVHTISDLAGIPRIISAQRSSV
jgi:release factor glutamine methyltransferase